MPGHRSICAALSMVVLLAATVTRADDGAGDWPMYNCDVRGTRHNRAETVLGPHNVARLVEKWRFPPKGDERKIGLVRATPIVVGGCVYFGTSTRPTFYKLTPDGKLAWSYRQRHETGEPMGMPIYGSALVSGQTVYFMDTAGTVFALDTETGRERWTVSTRDEPFPVAHRTNVSFASPIMAGDLLIIAGGAGEQGLMAIAPMYPCCSGRGYVAALDPDSGETVWAHAVGPEPQKLDPPITLRDAWGR